MSKQDETQLQEDQEQVVEEENDVVKQLEEEKKLLEDKYRRALADYQNLEKRVQEDKREWARFANKELLLRILPILDTLILAEKHSDDRTLKISVQQFLDILKSEGITKIEAVGREFDPHLMECVQTVDDGNEVIEEVRAGYMYHDKLLRPAQVKVGGKAPSN